MAFRVEGWSRISYYLLVRLDCAVYLYDDLHAGWQDCTSVYVWISRLQYRLDKNQNLSDLLSSNYFEIGNYT